MVKNLEQRLVYFDVVFWISLLAFLMIFQSWISKFLKLFILSSCHCRQNVVPFYLIAYSNHIKAGIFVFKTKLVSQAHRVPILSDEWIFKSFQFFFGDSIQLKMRFESLWRALLFVNLSRNYLIGYLNMLFILIVIVLYTNYKFSLFFFTQQIIWTISAVSAKKETLKFELTNIEYLS